MDKLVIDMQKGRLYLPISREKLSEMVASGYLRLETKKYICVMTSQPQ